MSHPWLLSHAPSSNEHFLFSTYLSYHTTENTQYIPRISKLTQSTSCAIKNHSGVEKPAEWRKPAHHNSNKLDENDIRRRDEKTKINGVNCADATDKTAVGKTLCEKKRLDLMLEIIAETANTQITKKR